MKFFPLIRLTCLDSYAGILKKLWGECQGRKWSIESRSKKFLSSPVCLDWLYAVGTVLIPLGEKAVAA
jgi:hypothetical protein